MERITSRTNPLLAQIRKLNTDAACRRESGLAVCDGPKLLAEALQWGAQLVAAVAAEGTSLPPLPQGVRAVEVPQDVLKSLSSTVTPQGVLFLCQRPDSVLPEQFEGSHYLVLDGVQDPGNVGAIWRTADAFGADGLILLGACADPFGPKAMRASMGACFRLPVWEAELTPLLERLAAADLPLFAAALRDDTVALGDAVLSRAAVVIGSEGAGVSQAVLARCTQTIKIPMRPRCESLNAAAAAAVILWEMRD